MPPTEDQSSSADTKHPRGRPKSPESMVEAIQSFQFSMSNMSMEEAAGSVGAVDGRYCAGSVRAGFVLPDGNPGIF